MAGVNPNDGTEAQTQNVPAMGGAEYRSSIGIPATSVNAASAHLTDQNRAEGVAYPEAFGGGPTGSGYPAGTAMTDSSPGDDVN
jgi:hypothetical protein